MTLLLFMFLQTGTVQKIEYIEHHVSTGLVGDVTKEVITGNIPRPVKNKLFSQESKATENWAFTDSCYFQGRIRNNGHYYAKIDSTGITEFLPDNNLTATALQAIEAVPEWLKIPLWDNFARMSTQCQNTYGALILASPILWQDELAFVIAYVDSAMLERHRSSPTIFTDNVRLIYKHDSVLDYVRLVEYPGYTTAIYKMANDDQDTTEIEIPRDIYYWHIVHPIIVYEMLFYINPYTADINHYGTGSAAPPTGKFWRDYYFNYPDTAQKTVWSCYGPADTIYAGTVSPILKDRLLGEKILYNNKIDVSDSNGAIGRVTKWVNDVMVFNADSGDMWNAERAWQPVRQYHMHRGRCGEWTAVTTAAARAALIPTNSPNDVTRDHTWNEWYDTDWHGWEPINNYVNSTGHYEDWGWSFRAIYNYRGNGYTWDVTPRYSQHCTLTVIAQDSLGRPLDGARVYLFAPYYYDNTQFALSDKKVADSDGRAEFLLGEGVDYCINVTATPRGCYPNTSGGYVKIITNSVAGQHYNWTCPSLVGATTSQPTIKASPGVLTDTTKFYKIDVNFDVPQEIIRGKTIFFNELNSHTYQQRYGHYVDVAKNIEFFICNSANFAAYQSGSTFEAFGISHNVDSGHISFVCPKDDWYVVFSTKDLVENEEVINLDVKLYKNLSAVEETPQKEFYLNVVSTVFKKSVIIDFMLPQKEKVQLGVYDLSGRCIREIIKDEIKIGYQRVELDGKKMSKGIYFIRLDAGTKVLTKKVVKI
ncbi:MAG: T9SS type A sorting domain-containing protein [bacterium]|nr:T9SS type A sorting domain-containing protein [bacterium]